MAVPPNVTYGPISGLNPPAVFNIRTLRDKMGGEWLSGFAWNQAYAKCQGDMPEFFETYFYDHPMPLNTASGDIQELLEDIHVEARWKGFRDQIDNLVGRMENVRTMICLGLGRYVGPPSTRNCWIVQYAVFVYIWEVVNRKWQDECKEQGIENLTPVQRIFQDPDFDKRTQYLLQRIPRPADPGANVVVEHPEAFQMLEADNNILVYAPHLLSRLNAPQVFIGNGSRASAGGFTTAMMEEYMEECKYEGTIAIGQKVDDLWARICAVKKTYREAKMNNEGPVDTSHLDGTSIYLRSA
ncbi:hypothetical protein E4T44_06339 [Aureobasidium sp. EXF-8845]|nr:hypothetical protein E4T44_06339 [Aureobasidium sp. EXF-8845]KAI4846478.1 hypothetical protein E4T45_07231 [Aureobasidium sp. EXF-8846]